MIEIEPNRFIVVGHLFWEKVKKISFVVDYPVFVFSRASWFKAETQPTRVKAGKVSGAESLTTRLKKI